MRGLNAKAQKKLDEVVTKFQAGDISPLVAVAKTQLADDAPASRWTVTNRVLAYATTGGGIDCRGYRQWQGVGRQVQKGEQAGYILVPLTVRNGDDEDDRQLVGFRGVAVFGYGQTDGDPVEGYAPKELPPLADTARRMGVAFTWEPTPDNTLGWVTADGSRAAVGTTDAKTFFHELAHAARAKLNGDLPHGDDAAAEEEIIAELAGTVLMEVYGLDDRTGNCWEYVKHFSKDPVRAIGKAAEAVSAVFGVLFDDDGKEH